MTLMDVVFRYRIPPGEHQMSALGRVREVYGVRKLVFDERERTVKVEYDASRWSKVISQLCCVEQVWISNPIKSI